MNQEELEIIAACIIGNGYLGKYRKKYYRLSFTHSFKQEDYLLWKVNLISNLDSVLKSTYKNKVKITTILTKHSNGKNFYQKRAYICRAKLLSESYKLFYKENNKNVYSLLEYMENSLSLAIWFMDNGYLIKNKSRQKDKFGKRLYLLPSSKLCTYDFSYEDNIYIKEWFLKKYNIQGNIVKDKDYFFITFDKDNTKKIWDIIKKYIEKIPSMYDKFDLCFKVYE